MQYHRASRLSYRRLPIHQLNISWLVVYSTSLLIGILCWTVRGSYGCSVANTLSDCWGSLLMDRPRFICRHTGTRCPFYIVIIVLHACRIYVHTVGLVGIYVTPVLFGRFFFFFFFLGFILL